MNELMVKENIKIEDMIYEIRGKQVMLDSDIAKLYHVETKRINEAVKNNIEKFPERFSWILEDYEWNNLRSKNSTSRLSNYGGRRYLPRVFTEQGIAMLATILKSSIAVETSINIMDAFVTMRKYIVYNVYEMRLSNIETKVIEFDNKFNIVMDKLDNTIDNHIFFEGQIYDAYSKIIDIFNESRNEIIIIDNYLDKNMLDIISKAKVKVILITANKLNNIDLVKYNKQYNNLNVIINNSFHDRFIILDRNTLYHLGASLNTLGKKCFAITKIEEKNILEQLVKKI